jgi:exodeoxyribonuclease III
MRIFSWNVNSVRTRETRLLAWLASESPDVLCLQETKVVDADFPLAAVEEAGYHAVFSGQKTYNGVAILSREPIERSWLGFEDGVEDPQARFIAAKIGSLRVASAYIPNGSSLDSPKYAYKKAWLKRLRAWLDREVDPQEPFVLVGDFNIAPEARDVADLDRWGGGVLYNEDMHAALAEVLAFGLEDAVRRVRDDEALFTWWDYRGLAFPRNDGLRIDHVYATAPMMERARAAEIDRDERKKGRCPEGTKPSDHVPVGVDFDFDFDS